MKYLIANYDIQLDVPVLLRMPEGERPRYGVSLNEFDVTLVMDTERSSAEKMKNEKNWKVPYTRFLISVKRAEQEFPPEVLPDDKGISDYTIQSDYFKDRRVEFGRAAEEMANRAIRYFKYRLWQPALPDFNLMSDFMNPVWTDEKGDEAGSSGGHILFKPEAAIMMQTYGSVPLEKRHRSSFLSYLKSSKSPSLKEEILYDAQSAICHGNYRRAILEMALSVEMAVKQTIFGKDGREGIAFEYLEDKGRINVKVIELVDTVSLQVFGSSFKKDHLSEFKQLDHLFRSRNKVAHRGETSFKDDSGAEHLVDRAQTQTWWQAISVLNCWLKGLGKRN